MQNATIFNPSSDDLERKVRALRDVQKSLDGIKASLEQFKSKGYDQSLGTEEELKQAFEVSQNSYNQAVKSLSSGDLKKAREKNLISTEEFQKLSVAKHKEKIQSIRGNEKNKSHTKDQSHRR